MQVAGNEARANTLNAMRAGCATTDHRRLRRFNSKCPEIREPLLEHFTNACDMSACTDTGDEVVDAVRKIFQNLDCRRLGVNADVGDIVELLRHP